MHMLLKPSQVVEYSKLIRLLGLHAAKRQMGILLEELGRRGDFAFSALDLISGWYRLLLLSLLQ